MDSWAPKRKVTAGVLAGAVTVIFVWLLGEFVKIEITPEVASAITTVFTFVISWLVPEPAAME